MLLRKIILFFEVARNMGFRYTTFRAWYEIRRRTGLLKRRFPVNPPMVNGIQLEAWRKADIPFFFESKASLNIPRQPTQTLKDHFERYVAGEIHFFNADYKNLGRHYDWITNSDTGYRYDTTQHWTAMEDFSATAGDIKYVWEKSRFSFLLPIIRYDYHFQQDCSQMVMQEIKNWIDANPINQGPNYKCSQEISIRLLNWTFALYYYKHTPALTEELFREIQNSIYWQLHHVRQNIHFSRIAVRNNHAISECLMLYLGGLLFPFLPHTQSWSKQGLGWFEQEIAYQIYPDGSYLQFSHNYQRVVVQLLTWALRLSQLNGRSLGPVVYERSRASLKFLRTHQVDPNGQLPNYGQNDGALFFPLSECDYRDYRPQLQALAACLNIDLGYGDGPWTEDSAWIGYTGLLEKADFPQNGPHSFDVGGFYVLRDQDTLTCIRCGNHKDRPAQADNLHLDIWIKGENVLRDAGTYKYNTDPDTAKHFQSTAAHNTCTLDGEDQMPKGPRFIWLHWSQAEAARWTETEEAWVFQGSIRAFRQLGKDILHTRSVKKIKGARHWAVHDLVGQQPATENRTLRQHWHPNPDAGVQLQLNSTRWEKQILHPKPAEGWYSGYYGQKTPSPALYVESKTGMIQTTIEATA